MLDVSRSWKRGQAETSPNRGWRAPWLTAPAAKLELLESNLVLVRGDMGRLFRAGQSTILSSNPINHHGRPSHDDVVNSVHFPPTILRINSLKNVTIHHSLLAAALPPVVTFAIIRTPFSNTIECSGPTRGNMGVNIEGCSEEEDFAYEEEA